MVSTACIIGIVALVVVLIFKKPRKQEEEKIEYENIFDDYLKDKDLNPLWSEKYVGKGVVFSGKIEFFGKGCYTFTPDNKAYKYGTRVDYYYVNVRGVECANCIFTDTVNVKLGDFYKGQNVTIYGQFVHTNEVDREPSDIVVAIHKMEPYS